MKKLIVTVIAIATLAVAGCYTEWDIPKVRRRDPCTRLLEEGYVYVNPTCRYPAPPPHPKSPD